MNLKAELISLIDLLNEAGVNYAVCGGLAMALHGHVRGTKDIDLLILKHDLEQIKDIAEKAGFYIPAGIIPFGIGTEDAREIYRVSKVIDDILVPLDLLLVAPSLQEVWNGRIVVEFEGRKTYAVSREGLIAMKRTAGRSQDLVDIEVLEKMND